MTKIFVVSLHRCATQSTELFLRQAGLRTCHWPAVVDGVDYQSQIAGIETAPDKIVQLLRPVFDKYEAFSDLPMPALFAELDKAYPGSRFVAAYRNPFGWIASVRQHCHSRALDPFERAQYWQYLDEKPTSLDTVGDDALLRTYLQHYQRLTAHFEGRDNFILLDLAESTIGARLSSFLHIRQAEFPRFDYKDAVSHRPENTLRALQHRVVELEATALEAGEYVSLARGMEEAQRYLLKVFDNLDPELLRQGGISPLADDLPAACDGPVEAPSALSRLIDTVDRANKLGLLFADSTAVWRQQQELLRRRLAAAYGALEATVGQRDRLQRQADIGRAAASAAEARRAPLVSIVLPVYNHAYLIDEAIGGVLSQRYQNWELIVVDDGSEDHLERRVGRYRGDRRILFLRQPNQKLPAALNHGFAHASGQLLTWTSADNIMLPDQLSVLVEELAAHPEAGLVYSDYWAIDDKGEPLEDPRWRPHNRDPQFANLIRNPTEVEIENFHQSGDNFIGPSFLYRRRVAEIIGGYADEAFGGEDYDYWLRMRLVTEFRHVREPLYKYRVHDDTLTARAEQLGLHANIRELLEADRWRRETLLDGGGLRRDDALLRPADQFNAILRNRCRPVAYGRLADGQVAASPDDVTVVDIDVPVRAVDAAPLQHADILLCRSELTAALLRREPWAAGKRVLRWTGEPTAELVHAFAQAFAEQATTPGLAARRRVPARIDAVFRPNRILLLCDRWAAGGLENVVIDLADALAAAGCTVAVASADGPRPAAVGERHSGWRTLSFGGDEEAFDRFLRREAIEVVNYHHSRFGVRIAERCGAATVYTMHNCYLWMDQSARDAVAAGLTGIGRMIAVSRQVAQFAVAQFGVPAERIVVVPNGLRDEFIAPAPPPARAAAPFVVAMVGSFTRLKLQHIAIAAFADAAPEIPDMRLRLIGSTAEADYLAQLHQQIEACSLSDRIDLVVGLSRAETIAALMSAHVMILPSLVEGCSVALLEAAAAGCVCIASDVGDARALALPDGPVVLLPSPLGELDEIDQRQFTAAAAAELPQHRRNLARALRRSWRDYAALAAAAAEKRALLRERHGMRQMTVAYLDAFTTAYRGGGTAAAAAACPGFPPARD